MQLKDKSGISCDHCGTSFRLDFTYYSFDFHKAEVYSNRRPDIESILKTSVINSLDICTICFEQFKTTIINNYSKYVSSVRKARLELVCDLSGQVMVGTYVYYYINIIKVE